MAEAQQADKTFRKFTAAQANSYASNRGYAYPRILYDAILDYHKATPGATLSTLLDVGCGPGKVSRDLVNDFQHLVGIDPGEGMIEAAKASEVYKNAETHGKDVRFQVCSAEESEKAELPALADVVTSALAAHWFDMPKFYESVAKVMKPGATLAMWTSVSLYVHPSDPHAKELQSILSHFEDNVLDPYHTDGNREARNGYKTLPLPWTVSPAIKHFDESSFKRVEWDVNGVPSAPNNPDGSPGPFTFSTKVATKQLQIVMSSASPVVRWREAHKEALEKGQDRDCLEELVEKLNEVLKDQPEAMFHICPSISLLLMKRGPE